MKEDPKEEIEIHVLVSGQVQGVGFRAATCSAARQLNLRGTVRNLVDGSVEIYAQGSHEKLETLLEHLKKAFHQNAINLNVKTTPTNHHYHDFRIV